MKARLYAKALLGVLIVLAAAMAAVDLLATRVAESAYIDNLTKDLGERGRLMSVIFTNGIDESNLALARRMVEASEGRLTVIGPDGVVLADSEADPATMENHATRPEFQEALRGERGSFIRTSATVGVAYLYVAVPIRGGALRLAVPLSDINEQVESIRWRMLGATAFAFVPAILIAAVLAHRTSRRLGDIINFAGELARGNFRARLPLTGRGELGILSRQLNEAGEHLQRSVEQLEREHAELEKLERVRKDFVINVSHELRTPLASIQGYTETLMDGALEDQANNMRFLGIIRQNAERLASLTADLLTLSRIELKRHNLHFSSYDIGEIVNEAIDTIRPVADKKNITIKRNLAPGAEGVYCDAEAVHQVLINLLDNAIKYTPEAGAIIVGVQPVKSTAKDRRIEISVRDSGIGIPAEDLPRLFERFYRVDKARSRELGGTGLGLAIVKHLVRAHGGDVRVESQLNQGSTFYFTLSSTVHDTVSVS